MPSPPSANLSNPQISKTTVKQILTGLIASALITLSAGATRIAVLSDIHVEPSNPCDSALKVAVNTINMMTDIDLVVVDGDLTNEGSDIQLRNVKATLDLVRHPIAVLPGNHENTWSQSATATFPALWGNDRFVTALESDSLLVVGINCGPYMKMGDGHIKQEDLHWLDKTLADNLKPGMRVLNLNHYPLNGDIDNINDYMAVLARYPVLLHVNGHYHQWQKYRSHADMIDCVTVRALEMKKREPRFGFTLLDIDGDNITVSEIAADGSATDEIYSFKTSRNHSFTRTDRAILPQMTAGEWKINRVWADSASVFTRLAIDNDNVYFATSTGAIRAVDKHGDGLRWKHQAANRSIFGRPTLAAGSLYVPTPCENLLVLNPADGTVTSSINLNDSPIVADGITFGPVYYQGGYKTFAAINPETNQLLWQLDDTIGNYCQATPATDGKDVVFGAWDTNLYCLDATDGRLKWSWNNGKPVNLFSPGNVVPVLLDDKVIIVAPDRYMTFIDRLSGKTIARDNSVKYRESLGVSPDRKTAYAKTMDGELIAVDITGDTIAPRWIADMGIGYEHAPCAVTVHRATGTVFAGSRQGIVTAVDPSGRVLWNARLGNSEVNGIDIDPTTGDLFVSLIEGTIWRISR